MDTPNVYLNFNEDLVIDVVAPSLDINSAHSIVWKVKDYYDPLKSKRCNGHPDDPLCVSFKIADITLNKTTKITEIQAVFDGLSDPKAAQVTIPKDKFEFDTAIYFEYTY